MVKLRDALAYLGWASVPMPGLAQGEEIPGYIIGPKIHCEIIWDAARIQLEKELEESMPKETALEALE
jgi:hypothetical protein